MKKTLGTIKLIVAYTILGISTAGMAILLLWMLYSLYLHQRGLFYALTGIAAFCALFLWAVFTVDDKGNYR